MTQFLSTPWTRVVHRDSHCRIDGGVRKRPATGRGARGCRISAAPAPPVATVDGTPISRTEYDIYLKSLLRGRPTTELTAEQRNQVLDEMINMQLLAGQAVKDGRGQGSGCRCTAQRAAHARAGGCESQNYLKDKEPTETELQAEYDTAIAAMDKTEYHARHILVATKEAGRSCHQEDQGRRQV